VRRSCLRFAVGIVGAGGIAVAGLGGSPLTVLAATNFTGYNLNTDGGCHNLNPTLEVNRSALTAVADNTRPYAQIKSVAVATSTTTVDGFIPEATVTVTLCGGIPVFPAFNGDKGVLYHACFTPASTEPIRSAPFGVVTNPSTPPFGNPAHDGPYPPSQGYRFCVWASVNALSGTDSGIAWYDPATGYRYLDSTVASVTPASFNFAAGYFTMYLPYTWRWTSTYVSNEPVIASGDITTDWVADAEVTPTGAPTAICVARTSPCVQGIIDLPTLVDFAPGYEVCTTPLVGCAQDSDAQGMGMDLGVEMDYPVTSIETCFNPLNPANDDPGFAGPDTPCNIETGIGAAGVPWTYAPVYGRILPDPIVPIGGFNYHPFGLLLPDNVSASL
jgi:hypothetical protein